MVVLCLLFVSLSSFIGSLYLIKKYIMYRKFKQRYQQFHQQTDYLLWSQKKKKSQDLVYGSAATKRPSILLLNHYLS